MNEEKTIIPMQQRKYICETITELVHDDVVMMYRFISTCVNINDINTHGNGCSVNLDNIDDNIVRLIYDLIWTKRNE
jgi:hypothetical protein